MQYSAHAESHVPCFQERVGTRHPGYMIPVRLPWRLRARPSATLHEIQVRFPREWKDKLVLIMLQKGPTPRQEESQALAASEEIITRICHSERLLAVWTCF